MLVVFVLVVLGSLAVLVLSAGNFSPSNSLRLISSQFSSLTTESILLFPSSQFSPSLVASFRTSGQVFRSLVLGAVRSPRT